jgi:hypothetical protein
MFENYMLLTRGFQNVRQDNKVVGFQILVKIAYYRGVFLPIIGDFQVAVDGEKFGVDKMKISVGRHTYTFDETAQVENVRWEFGKPLTITVMKPGGLKPGIHEIFFLQNIKPSYTGERGRISSVTKKMALVQ